MNWVLMVPIAIALGWHGPEYRIEQVSMENGPACEAAAKAFAPHIRGLMACLDRTTGAVIKIEGTKK